MVEKLTDQISFQDLLNSPKAEQHICNRLAPYEQNLDDYLRPWRKESMEKTYPSQGLLRTPYDDLDYAGQMQFPEERMVDVLRVRSYLLEIFNHPDRIEALQRETQANRPRLPAVDSEAIKYMQSKGTAISIGDLGAVVSYPQDRAERISRKKRLQEGPFIKIGRSAHSPFVGSAMPDVFGSAPAIAPMAASHSLLSAARNPGFVEIYRQADPHPPWL